MIFKEDVSHLTTCLKRAIFQLDLLMDTSMYFWMFSFSVSVPVVHLLAQTNFILQAAFWSCPCTKTFWIKKTVIWCITWMGINLKYFFYYYMGCEISSFIISCSPHNLIITNILTVDLHFNSFFKKPQMLLKEGNRFWEEGLPYGKKVQEKSKPRIKHMEKCLYGINQVSLMEVIFGLSWFLFKFLTINSLHLIFYQCWQKRKKGIKMKLQENK